MPSDILTPHEINKNRVIEMKISSGDVGNRDWRYNLYRLSDIGRAESGYQMMSSDIAENFVVDPDVYLLLNDAKGISIKAGTSTPIADTIGKLSNTKVGFIGTAVTAAAGIASGVNAAVSDDGSTSGTFMPWGQNIIAWKGTGPITLNYKFEFHMGQYGLWNAKEEVIKPLLCLVAPVLPQHINSFMQYGPFPNAWGMVANVIKDLIKSVTGKRTGSTEDTETKSNLWEGDDVGVTDESSEDGFFQKIGKWLEGVLVNSYKKYTFDIRFGNYMTLNKMLMTECKVSFSNEVDDQGYPISGTADCTFEGILPPAYSSSTLENRGLRFGAGTDVLTKTKVSAE